MKLPYLFLMTSLTFMAGCGSPEPSSGKVYPPYDPYDKLPGHYVSDCAHSAAGVAWDEATFNADGTLVTIRYDDRNHCIIKRRFTYVLYDNDNKLDTVEVGEICEPNTCNTCNPNRAAGQDVYGQTIHIATWGMSTTCTYQRDSHP